MPKSSGQSNGSSSDAIPALGDHIPVDSELTPQPQFLAAEDERRDQATARSAGTLGRNFIGRHPVLTFASGIALGALLAGILRGRSGR